MHLEVSVCEHYKLKQYKKVSQWQFPLFTIPNINMWTEDCTSQINNNDLVVFAGSECFTLAICFPQLKQRFVTVSMLFCADIKPSIM